MNRAICFSRLIVLLVAILFFSPLVEAKMYKCTKKDGKISFQDKSCKKDEATEIKEIVPQAKGKLSSSAAIAVYPFAKLKSKDINNGYTDMYDYKSTHAFDKIVDFYSKPAKNKKCEGLRSGGFTCKYKPLIGYSYGEVYVNKYSKHVLISIFKHLN